MLSERKPPQGVLPQPKVIRVSSPDFRINPYSDPDACWIVAKMWIHYLVSVNDFAECRENRPVTL